MDLCLRMCFQNDQDQRTRKSRVVTFFYPNQSGGIRSELPVARP